MTWYSAHIILGMQKEQNEESPITVWENIVLIEAASSDEAYSIANKIGQDEAAMDDGLTIDDMPVTRIFAGIRKIISISNVYPRKQEDSPISGTELTYSEYEVKNKAALIQLAQGESLVVKYVE